MCSSLVLPSQALLLAIEGLRHLADQRPKYPCPAAPFAARRLAGPWTRPEAASWAVEMHMEIEDACVVGQ